MSPIDPDLWRRADALFQDAIDLPAGEREAFVARACAGDAALLAAARELLAADTDAGGLLDTPVAALAPEALAAGADPDAAAATAERGAPAEPPDPWIGRSLGRFRIVRRVGEGGMGIVYEAEQEEPRRRVALKLMRVGWSADPLGLRFFRREAQTLARLQHPGIAAIYEAGTTDDGQPFFAMELVRGMPFDAAFGAPAHAAANAAELRERLDLFLEVCDAIAYAHQRGVIHRDLKPSNVLVVEEAFRSRAARAADPSTASSSRAARVKVVDFGLARMSDADVSMVVSQTEPRALQGTLPYMSPEQTLGRPEEIDFRSDVYSLGVILYRLLAGAPPYEVRADALLEAVRAIREEAPRKAGSVAPLLRGDVETILAKALEKEPDRRYQSVSAFADDIRRFLTDQPILARPASALYQLRKLAARHRAAAALLLTLGGVLVAATIALSISADAQRRERAKAVSEAEKATAVSDFLTNMFAAVDPEYAVGVDVTVHEVLDAAARDVDSKLRDSPEVASALQLAIGRAYVSLGLYDAAEPQLLASLDTRRSLFGEDHPEFASALLGVGQLYVKNGKAAESESLLVRALEIRRNALGMRDPKVADVLFQLGGGARERGDYARSDSLHRMALGILLEIDPESPGVLAGLITTALAVQEVAKYAEAETLYHRALALGQKLYGESHPQYAQALNNLGLLYTDQRRLPEAETTLRRALDVRRAAFGPEHPEVAITMNNLARALRLLDRCEDAVPLYEGAIAIFEKRLGPAHLYTNATRSNLGVCYDLMRRPDLAVAMYEGAIATIREKAGPDHPVLVKIFNNLANTLLRAGEVERAAEAAAQGIAIQSRSDPEHPDFAMVAHSLLTIRRAQKRFAEAESLGVIVVEMRRRLLGADHLDTAGSETRLAELLLRRGRIAEAESLLLHAYAVQSATQPANSWRVALTTNVLGACRLAQGRLAEAESLLSSSIDVIEASSAMVADDRIAARERLAALRAAR